ncbi:nuclear transport factor 2 family protein [Rhizobium sp. AG855]|uniref:nuclear transport factor 2 family protein n=1 Tax=Rhizobium sp. AG855 TaxID=2183898 RepID=UPI000FF5F683|nr:nuclear transport factor 2 family protein [Rhizobium sp. AG855]RKE76983.1 uncharacterized protein DUF4440 [Rhizobium sp. AG855]
MSAAESVVHREAARQRAMLAGDVDALRDLLDESLHYGHSSGGSDCRESYLAKIAGGATVYERLVLEVEKVVDLATGVAMALGTMKGSVRLPERTVEVDSRFMTVWRFRDGRWQMVGHQTVSGPR